MLYRKPRLVFVNRIDRNNVGDLSCSIRNSLSKAAIEMLQNKYLVHSVDINQYRKLKPGDYIIVGGGGLINPSFKKFWEHIKDNNYIVIGAGQNFGSDKKTGIAKPTSADEFALFDKVVSNSKFTALRDRNPGIPYCICPSIQIVEAFLNLTHSLRPKSGSPLLIKHHQVALPDTLNRYGLNLIKNSHGSAFDILSNIWNASEVFTSSYHAFLWSTLLGKKVTVVPFSSKFINSPYIDQAEVAKDLEDLVDRISNPTPNTMPKPKLSDLRFNVAKARGAYQDVLATGLEALF